MSRSPRSPRYMHNSPSASPLPTNKVNQYTPRLLREREEMGKKLTHQRCKMVQHTAVQARHALVASTSAASPRDEQVQAVCTGRAAKFPLSLPLGCPAMCILNMVRHSQTSKAGRRCPLATAPTRTNPKFPARVKLFCCLNRPPQ